MNDLEDEARRSSTAVAEEGGEQESTPLLPAETRADDDELPPPSSYTQNVPGGRFKMVIRSLAPFLGASLAISCVVIGMYLFYFAFHLPILLSSARNAEPELIEASLIDISDNSILVSTHIKFPNWTRHTTSVPLNNVSIYHRDALVGWFNVNDLEITSSPNGFKLYKVFHIVDQRAMEDLVSGSLNTRIVEADARVTVDLSGFGKFLPVVHTKRPISISLPSEIPPALPFPTLYNMTGPVIDPIQGGMTVYTSTELYVPFNITANLDAVSLDVVYSNVTIGTVDVGPVLVQPKGVVHSPVKLNVRQISGHAHETALADLVRATAAGEDATLIITGAKPEEHQGSPLWLRKALNDVHVSVNTSVLQPLLNSSWPSINSIIKGIVVQRLYAHWDALNSFSPWVSVSGQAMLEVPIFLDADLDFGASISPSRLVLLEGGNRMFATVDISRDASPIQVQQMSSSRFEVSCYYGYIVLDVMAGRESQFTSMMKRALVDRHLKLGINSTLDIELTTPIGTLHIANMPMVADIDHTYVKDKDDNSDITATHIASNNSLPEVAVTRVHIPFTTKDMISVEVDFSITNPLQYGAYITDLAMILRYAGLDVATVGVKELSIEHGHNMATLYIDFYNHYSDPRQAMLFLEASMGKNITMEIVGFPNCTSIPPLEASLRQFSQKFTIDTSRFVPEDSIGCILSSSLPKALQEVVFHIFSMSVEATIVNPVSGANIWIQSLEAIGYYEESIPVGALQYAFTTTSQGRPLGMLLPFDTTVTTPLMPVVANKSSIGWDMIRKAIGGTLDVDVFTTVSVLVGKAPINVTVVGKHAPVEIRL